MTAPHRGARRRCRPSLAAYLSGTVALALATFVAHRRMVQPTERLLHQAQRMEDLGQLAGGIAHDVNNMLAVMLSYAEFIGEELERAAEEDPRRWEPVLADLAHIADAGQRAAELTQQLLSLRPRCDG